MLGNMTKILGQMQNLQEHLKNITVEGIAGDGAVKVIMNCQQNVLSVRFNPDIVAESAPQRLEQLILEAFTVAQGESKARAKTEVQKTTGFNLSNLPGLF